MRTLVLYLFVIIFIPLKSAAQDDTLHKIFSSNHFSITVESVKEEKIYDFNKHNKEWIMEYWCKNKELDKSLHLVRRKKIFCDNLQTLHSILIEKADQYWFKRKTYNPPIKDELSYTITDDKNNVVFNAFYFNIRKVLNSIGWAANKRRGTHTIISSDMYYHL